MLATPNLSVTPVTTLSSEAVPTVSAAASGGSGIASASSGAASSALSAIAPALAPLNFLGFVLSNVIGGRKAAEEEEKRREELYRLQQQQRLLEYQNYKDRLAQKYIYNDINNNEQQENLKNIISQKNSVETFNQNQELLNNIKNSQTSFVNGGSIYKDRFKFVSANNSNNHNNINNTYKDRFATIKI